MFDQTKRSESERSVIINNKHGRQELHHELRNNLRLRILNNIRNIIAKLSKNFQINIKISNIKTLQNYSLVFSLPPELKMFSMLAKCSWKVEFI